MRNKEKRKYGQFDWAESYFADTDLSNTKPRWMMQKVVEILGVRIDEFPIKTFYSWYSKYHKIRYPKKRNGQKTEVRASHNKTTSSKKKPSWMDFEPSVPVPLASQKESILRIVVDHPET